MPKKALKTVPTNSHSEIAKRLAYFEERNDQMVQTIRQLVEIESPSDNKAAVDNLGALLASRFEGLGGHAKFHRVPDLAITCRSISRAPTPASRCCCLGTWTRCIPWGPWRPCLAAWPMDAYRGQAASI